MTKKFIIVDAHEDIAFHLNYFNRDFVNPDMPCMITLPRLKEANIRIVFNTVFIHPKHKPDKMIQSGIDQLDKYDEIYKIYPDDIYQIKKAQDLNKIGEDTRIGFLTLIEGADPIEDVSRLDEFYRRGVRIIGPAWNNKNKYASGNDSEDGLSDEGVELIHKMNELGITLDLSHLNEKSFWQSIELTELIPIATHSNSRALTDHPRNLRDEQLKAVSERGGVTGIVLYNYFLKTGEDTPTGGRIKIASKHLDGDTFMATYGDGVGDVDLNALLAFHRKQGTIGTVTVVTPVSQFGEVVIGEGNRVKEFREKPKVDKWVNGGFFVFEREFLSYLGQNDILERGPLEKLAARGQLSAYRHRGFWQCMDTFKDASALNDLWSHGKAPWKIWEP